VAYRKKLMDVKSHIGYLLGEIGLYSDSKKAQNLTSQFGVTVQMWLALFSGLL
jgi:predicted DNA-binding ribbon-helix-helix protein